MPVIELIICGTLSYDTLQPPYVVPKFDRFYGYSARRRRDIALWESRFWYVTRETRGSSHVPRWN